jgi:uncharacterized protein (TIGR03435 family)
MAQALELEYFSHVYTNNEPTYSIIAKVSKPQPSQQLHAMLLSLLMEGMGVRYHIEKRPIQAWFINVVSLDLLKKLPVSNDPLPISFAFPVPRFPPVIIPQSWEFVRRGIPVQGVSEVTARNVTFRLFAEALRADCRCLVIDETGLPQRFNFDKFTTRMYDSEATSAESLEDVTKLLKDYGISLKARKGVVDFLVIDKVADEKKFLN